MQSQLRISVSTAPSLLHAEECGQLSHKVLGDNCRAVDKQGKQNVTARETKPVQIQGIWTFFLFFLLIFLCACDRVFEEWIWWLRWLAIATSDQFSQWINQDQVRESLSMRVSARMMMSLPTKQKLALTAFTITCSIPEN